MSNQNKVKDFMVLAGQAVPDKIETPEANVRILRVKLLLEEVMEFAAASGVKVAGDLSKSVDSLEYSADSNIDVVEVADGLADIEYVLLGAAVAYGINFQPVFDEVHDSNMKKFGPGGYRREDGKWVKPADWQKPDLKKVLNKQKLQTK